MADCSPSCHGHHLSFFPSAVSTCVVSAQVHFRSRRARAWDEVLQMIFWRVEWLHAWYDWLLLGLLAFGKHVRSLPRPMPIESRAHTKVLTTHLLDTKANRRKGHVVIPTSAELRLIHMRGESPMVQWEHRGNALFPWCAPKTSAPSAGNYYQQHLAAGHLRGGNEGSRSKLQKCHRYFLGAKLPLI